MGVRVGEPFKVAPGAEVRVNAKSTCVSFSGEGIRYSQDLLALSGEDHLDCTDQVPHSLTGALS
jgi:hypothetical protein